MLKVTIRSMPKKVVVPSVGTSNESRGNLDVNVVDCNICGLTKVFDGMSEAERYASTHLATHIR